MHLRTHVPAPPLASYVECVWVARGVDGEHDAEAVLPTGRAQLIVNLRADRIVLPGSDAGQDPPVHRSGAVLNGVYTRPLKIDTDSRRDTVGVAFRPGGAAPFLDVPVSELRNRTVSLDAVWGRAGATLRERLRAAPSPAATVRVLTEALHEQLAAEGPPDVVTAAVERIRRANGQVSVQTLVEESGYSHRHFTDRFRRAVGLPPKRFSRIVRLQDVLRRIRASTAGNGARLAAACGYADQSHLIREMRRLTGITPEAYRRRAPAEPHHVPLTE